MSVVKWEKKDRTAVVWMDNGANTQNLIFAQELNRCLDEAVADADVTAIILTSTDPKSFSQGVDVQWMGGAFADGKLDDIKGFMYGMNEVFTKLLTLPVPTIAAINGHAFGNGAILSCACDFRLMRADRGYFCFPEVDLGIPFLPGMLAFVKKAFAYDQFHDLYLTGRRAGAAELAERKMLVKASDSPEALQEDALAFAATFAKKRSIFGIHKARDHKHILDIMKNEDKEVIESLVLFVTD
ncbi:enoyl-CoA hydratase/isomerase family protein [Desulfoluna sp.]|uniref:enoyl-CoA hydratase/isomerase family protein n=1 Tax=Desulfoluna sp. TaxID=2045199 RepID=UPI00260D4B34|nr:enoyl-CoA hydratase/isomerase family protein [Desulfoluna sp.]